MHILFGLRVKNGNGQELMFDFILSLCQSFVIAKDTELISNMFHISCLFD